MAITIQGFTTRTPITMIGREAGVCWGADIEDDEKNHRRGLNCLGSGHGRTFEFPDVYVEIDGYSARTMRQIYTHIGGLPTRLQSSTRYIDYQHGFDYVTPPSVSESWIAKEIYDSTMEQIALALRDLDEAGIPREDSAMLLPLGMSSKMVGKYNLRTLIDMSHQRECSRTYWEFREFFRDLKDALRNYSDEWKTVVDTYFKPKCEVSGFCEEAKSCGRKPKREA